jgi:hypothetical protein
MGKIAAASFLLLMFSLNSATAQPMPLGQELGVNTNTAGYQYGTSVAMNNAGQFVVVWSGAYSDGDGYGIFGRRYDSSGTPVGGTEFQINTFTENNQFWARVGMEKDGDFVVAWSGAGPGDDTGVFIRRFNSSGVARGSEEFKVNSYTTYQQQHPAIVVNRNGRFVVVWGGTGPGDYDGVFARRFTRFGKPDGAPMRVNEFTLGDQRLPAVGMDGKANFVVTWQDSGALDGSLSAVAARRFSSNGTPLDSSEFVVNTWTTGGQVAPSIAMTTSGAFVVAWTSIGQDDPTSAAVAARRFDKNGVAADTKDFLVNALTMSNQSHPRVAMDKSGGFVISWHDYSGYLIGTGYDIRARRFASTGAALDLQEFAVNSYTTNWQTRPSVAMSPRGQFIISWESAHQDGDQGGVFAQKLDCEDTDMDGLCDPVDILISSHADGDPVDCATPGDASTRPLFTWQRGNYDKFRTMISWDPGFPKNMRITSGAELSRRSRWKPSQKQWQRACNNASPDLYIRVFGVDNQLGNRSTHKGTRSNTVMVDTSPLP